MATGKIQGSIRCRLVGGPLDGAHYGDLPDPGRTPSGAHLSIPLATPPETSIRAIYLCVSPGGPNDIWEFMYAKTVFPGLPVGTEVSFR